MRIGIITRTLPPHICGIGDHSIFLSNALRSLGHQVITIAGQGETGKDVHIVGDDWSSVALSKLLQQLDNMKLEHLVLQYAPLMFSTGRGKQNFALLDFWQTCSKQWKTSLILHETYFRVWWYPPSWIKGSVQKDLLKLLVNTSHFVFSASQPLIDEIKRWGRLDNITLLPIGSNFPISANQRSKMRHQHQIESEDIILTLFGGGNALRWLSFYVNHVDALLRQHRLPIRWLLLGGVPRKWFRFNSPVISPGRLSPKSFSAWLQVTDIFLLPHICGLSAKRGTLMAALQHGLPVVGTKGWMTEQFWADVSGVTLASMPWPKNFSKAVLKLSTDQNLRQMQGQSNHNYYQMHFTWDRIASTFLKSVS